MNNGQWAIGNQPINKSTKGLFKCVESSVAEELVEDDAGFGAGEGGEVVNVMEVAADKIVEVVFYNVLRGLCY